MLNKSLELHEFNIGLLRRLLLDLSDADLTTPIGPGHHSGLWVLGHLALCTQLTTRLLGAEVAIAPERLAAFGPASSHTAPLPPGLSKQSLLAELRAGHQSIAAAIPTATAAALSQPHDVSFLLATPLKTKLDLVIHLLTTHAAFHIGQISVYRRALGKPHLF